MGDISPERRPRCGLFRTVFGRRRKSAPEASSSKPYAGREVKEAFLDPSNGTVTATGSGASNQDRVISRPEPNQMKSPPRCQDYHHPPPEYTSDHQQMTDETPVVRYTPPAKVYTQTRKVPYGAIGISGELDTMINDYQRTTGATKLVRASSGNVMLQTTMGNLRQPGGRSVVTQNNNNSYDYNKPPNARQDQQSAYSTGVINNVVKNTHNNDQSSGQPTTISARRDPEELKILGNEDYKNGRFKEALALYDAAITIEPNKASYRTNRSAALTAMGKLLQAVFECREAIRIDPFNQRAHNRLASLHLRLGEPEKVMYHYKQSKGDADPDVLQKAKNLEGYLNKCTNAKRQRDWTSLIRECNLAISTVADSAPLVFALRAEALLSLHMHQDADETMKKCPKFEVDECTKFFGPIGHAALLVIQAQVDLAAGRFENAIASSQLAASLDPNNEEASVVARKTMAVAEARSKGNELFKSGQHSEACNAYDEGLSYDPYNSTLLCNRAACQVKLGLYEQALDDCNAALSLRPNFSKARLRRADCCEKIGDWETCIQDYGTLLTENPHAEEVAEKLKKAKAQLRR